MALHYAVRNKMLIEIRSLVESGSNTNARDKDRRTPLMLCCVEEDEKFAAGVARMLLQAGAKVGLVDKDGRNSLMLAAIFGRSELNELYLKAVDFDLNTKESFGNTALHFAALKGNVDVASKLLTVFARSGVRINSRNRMGQTAAALALQRGHVTCVELFRNMSADFSTKVPSPLLMRPWSADLKYVQNPNLMLQQAMGETILGTSIHQSRSELNVHQFRRGSRVPEDRILTRSRSSKRRTRPTRSISNLSYSKPRMQPVPKVCNSISFPLLSREKTEDVSWKIMVSELMDVLRVQVSPSYRRSVVGVPQTYEDVFQPPEPIQINQTETEDFNEKKALSGCQDGRRKNAAELLRNKAKSDLSDNFSTQSSESKRKNRRSSLQAPEATTLQRKRPVVKLT